MLTALQGPSNPTCLLLEPLLLCIAENTLAHTQWKATPAGSGLLTAMLQGRKVKAVKVLSKATCVPAHLVVQSVSGHSPPSSYRDEQVIDSTVRLLLHES